MAQLVKNLPVMSETWVLSLGWEDPLKKGTTTLSALRNNDLPSTMNSSGGTIRQASL